MWDDRFTINSIFCVDLCSETVKTSIQRHKIMSRWRHVSPCDVRSRPVTISPSLVQDGCVVSQRQHLIVVVVSCSFSSYLRRRKVGRQPPTDRWSLPEEGEIGRRKRVKNSVIHRKASSSVIRVVEDRPDLLERFRCCHLTGRSSTQMEES